jgi:hypothetical protein
MSVPRTGLLVYFVLIGFVLAFHTELHYERDANSLLFGSRYLELSRDGALPIYRYALQPLTYELLSLVYRWTESMRLLSALPGLAGAAGIALLVATLQRRFRSVEPVALVALVALVPELFFSLLYVNGSAFGLGCFGAAIFMLLGDAADPPSADPRELSRGARAGASAALGCLFRFDFLMALPMLCFLIVRLRPRPVASLAGFTGGLLVVFLMALTADVLRPLELYAELIGHQNWARDLKWPLSGAFRNAAVSINFFGWLGVAASALLIVRRWILRRDAFDLIFLTPIAVLLYPLPDLVSPKYLLPALCFVPLLLGLGLAEANALLSPQRRWIPGAVVVTAAGIVQVMAIHPTARPPYLHVDLGGRLQLDTADGERPWGGYLRHYAGMKPVGFLEAEMAVALADAMRLRSGGRVLLVGSVGGWLRGFPFIALPLELERRGYDVEATSGQLVARSPDGRSLVVVVDRSREHVPAIRELLEPEGDPIWRLDVPDLQQLTIDGRADAILAFTRRYQDDLDGWRGGNLR